MREIVEKSAQELEKQQKQQQDQEEEEEEEKISSFIPCHFGVSCFSFDSPLLLSSSSSILKNGFSHQIIAGHFQVFLLDFFI